jgi:putative colanic acid biosynthesis acetyltransferase WcaF
MGYSYFVIRNLALFQSQIGFSVRVRYALWKTIFEPFFKNMFCPKYVRQLLLKLFGCEIGKSIQIRKGVSIHFPWNLSIGDNSWIGENVNLINHAKIRIGKNVCISQGVTICSSGHNFKTSELSYKHSPIDIHDGAWIALSALILPGVTIGANSVVSGGEVVANNISSNTLFKSQTHTKIRYQ